MQNSLHFSPNLLVSSQHVQSKQIFLEIQVDVRLKVGEPDWVLELVVFYFPDLGVTLDQDVTVQVVDDVVQLLINDLLHVNLDLGLEVIKSVEETSDVSLQGPADL